MMIGLSLIKRNAYDILKATKAKLKKKLYILGVFTCDFVAPTVTLFEVDDCITWQT